MLIIGITGNLGCGKSTVAAMFVKRGGKLIDADSIVRELLTKNKKCIKKVAKIFPGVILENEIIDRLQLAEIVFNNPRELHKLTNILFPEALKVVKQKIFLYKNESLVVLDVPLLFESGWDKITDINIVVKAKRAQQFERAQKRLGLSQRQVQVRLRHQMPLNEKCALADILIDNSQGLRQTEHQVDEIMNRLKKIKN